MSSQEPEMGPDGPRDGPSWPSIDDASAPRAHEDVSTAAYSELEPLGSGGLDPVPESFRPLLNTGFTSKQWPSPRQEHSVADADSNNEEVSHESDNVVMELSDRPSKFRKSEHSEKAAYVCQECGKAFERPGELRKHSKYHVPKSERPIPCNLCSERFHFPKDLERHQQTQHGPRNGQLQCMTCGKSFTERRSLIRHENTSHYNDGRKFACQYCLLTFKRKDTLKRHESHSHMNTSRRSGKRPISANTSSCLEDSPQMTSTSADDGSYRPAWIARLPSDSLADQRDQRPNNASVQPEDLSAVMPGSATFEYTPLPTKSTIRLLHLNPGRDDNRLTCFFSYVDLYDPNTERSYETLSYSWDNLEPPMMVYIEEGQSMKTMEVQSTVFRALRALRYPHSRRCLWVDSLCINQQDLTERGSQVSIISSIYQKAASVCIWLGDHSEDSKTALDVVRNAGLDGEIFQVHTTFPHFAKNWNAFANLTNRSWFTRTWAVQEVALARSASLHCGDDTVQWHEFEFAVSLFEQSASHILFEARKFGQAQIESPFAENAITTAAMNLIDVKRTILRRNKDNHLVEYMQPLGDLLVKFADFQATDVLDKVYSLLALAQDIPRTQDGALQQLHQGHLGIGMSADDANENYASMSLESLTPKIIPDYSLSIVSLCKSVFAFIVKTSDTRNSLDILCRPWAPDDQDDMLPSWILSHSHSPFQIRPSPSKQGTKRRVRKNHDPLVVASSSASSNTSPYRACADHKATWRLLDNNDKLVVEGFEIDEIGKASAYSQLGNIPPEWFNMVKWQPWNWETATNEHVEPPEEFLRTLVADRASDGGDIKAFYSKALGYAMRYSSNSSGVEVALIPRLGNASLEELLPRITAVVWNRRLVRTSLRGFLGLAPKKAEPGDIICIIHGCSVPLVLRRREELYELIGECYVHGIMYGEAVRLKTAENIKTKEFTIR